MYNEGAADDIIRGRSGDDMFCSNCELDKTCQYKDRLPKVMRCCTDAIEFYFANQNYKNYIWKGSYRDQPIWLMEMSGIVGRIKKEVDKEKANNGN